jgi:hypothetical protein
MADTQVHNESSYTLSIVDAPILERGSIEILRINADAAIKHIADHIKWNGTLDFVIRFDADRILGDYWQPNGAGFAGYIQGWGATDRTPAHAEAITGIDGNGTEYDAGMWVNPDNVRIKDYGQEMYLDPSPDLSKDNNWITQRDLVELFLHETMHSLGFVTRAQYGGPPSSFDKLTTEIGNSWHFAGAKGQEIYGGPIPLAGDGYRGHFGLHLSVGDHLMEDFGLPGRSLLSNLELGVLQDLGYTITKWVDLGLDSSNDTTDPITGAVYTLDSKKVRVINNFDSSSDKLEIPDDLIGRVSTPSFFAIKVPLHPGRGASNKELAAYKRARKKTSALEKRIDRIGDTFIFNHSTGEFYVDTNGTKRGLGGGGVLAIVEREIQPIISMDNILL